MNKWGKMRKICPNEDKWQQADPLILILNQNQIDQDPQNPQNGHSRFFINIFHLSPPTTLVLFYSIITIQYRLGRPVWQILFPQCSPTSMDNVWMGECMNHHSCFYIIIFISSCTLHTDSTQRSILQNQCIGIGIAMPTGKNTFLSNTTNYPPEPIVLVPVACPQPDPMSSKVTLDSSITSFNICPRGFSKTCFLCDLEVKLNIPFTFMLMSATKRWIW